MVDIIPDQIIINVKEDILLKKSDSTIQDLVLKYGTVNGCYNLSSDKGKF